jgi:hypothetical protein
VLGCLHSLSIVTLTYLSMPKELSLQDVTELSTDSLLAELESTFPEESPNRTESLEDLMWRGGQRNVVNWIRERINDG